MVVNRGPDRWWFGAFDNAGQGSDGFTFNYVVGNRWFYPGWPGATGSAKQQGENNTRQKSSDMSHVSDSSSVRSVGD